MPTPDPAPAALTLLEQTYTPLLAFADAVDEATGWAPTTLPGWAVRDLLFHLALDAQRALVAFGTPTDASPDTDEVSYWTEWQPGTEGAQAGLRGVRISASAWSSVRGPADLFAETARAVLVSARRVAGDSVVVTQGRRLTVESLLRTLVVEATIHHLDFGTAVGVPPAAEALTEVRRVLDALFGRPVPAEWDDTSYVLLGTGRRPLTEAERAELGPDAERFPLFG